MRSVGFLGGSVAPSSGGSILRVLADPGTWANPRATVGAHLKFWAFSIWRERSAGSWELSALWQIMQSMSSLPENSQRALGSGGWVGWGGGGREWGWRFCWDSWGKAGERKMRRRVRRGRGEAMGGNPIARGGTRDGG